MTIREAIENIEHNQLLIPEFQRGYVWKAEQVEALFDSILNNYPIGTFLFWDHSNETQSKLAFHEFLEDYNEYDYLIDGKNYGEKVKPEQSFQAVIDGQQRLNSLYIGMKGTFANCLPHCWRNNKENYPKRSLYLCLEENNQSSKQPPYFRLLTDQEYNNKQKEGVWIAIKTIFQDEYPIKVIYERIESLENTLQEKKDVYLQQLLKLYITIYYDNIINIFTTKIVDTDTILDIFIQVNSKGTRLTKSDLLMSLTVAKWSEAKDNFKNLIGEIKQIDYTIDNDFILKTCLVLTSNKNNDISYRIENVAKNIELFKSNWSKIERSTRTAFELIKELGFTDFTIHTKTPIIPIIYWLFKIENPLPDLLKEKKNINKITTWLMFAYIYGLFSSHSADTYLNRAKEIINDEPNCSNVFPTDKINEKYKEYAKLQLNDDRLKFEMDNEFIDELLKSQYNTSRASFVLALLYRDTIEKARKDNQLVHQDHLHPAIRFCKEDREFQNAFPREEDKEFALDKCNHNSILNLQLLPARINTEKKDRDLETWYSKQYPKPELYIESETSLKLEDFREFIKARKNRITNVLRALLQDE